MDIEAGTWAGDKVISAPFILLGTVTGTMLVVAGGQLDLRGTCGGPLILLAGAQATVQGTVEGVVVNYRGTLEVFGTVQGTIHRLAGSTTLHPGAIVQGSTY